MMITKPPKIMVYACTAICLLSSIVCTVPESMAGGKHGKDYRRYDSRVEHEIIHHERERRAFVAGAVAAQHHDGYREGYRDGYRERYRDRYYDHDRRYYYDHDDDDRDEKIGAALVGVAVGAVVTGAVMSDPK